MRSVVSDTHTHRYKHSHPVPAWLNSLAFLEEENRKWIRQHQVPWSESQLDYYMDMEGSLW